MFHRLFSLLCALALLFGLLPVAFAEDAEDIFIKPTLSPNAIPYDSKHPEFLDPTMLYAQSAILIEADSGEVLFEKNADQIMYPASTTKILTAYIALQMCDLENDVVTISQEAIDLVPPTYATIPVSAGEEVNMGDLIAATMVRSGNEGANAIGEFISGDIYSFSLLMNQTAQMLGCSEDTHFANPSGAHDENHYTTARDMSIIARAAMMDERFAKIVSKNTYEMPMSNKRPSRSLVGGTYILSPDSESFYYSPADGIKTGFTNKAGYCFVGSARKGGIRLISVVFYTTSEGRWTDTKKMMEYGFTQVQSISPEALYAEEPRSVEIMGFSLDDSNHGELVLGIRAVDEERDMTIVGNQEKIDMLRQNFSQVSTIRWTSDFRAPINIGDTLGILTYYAENGETADYELVATRSVAMRENAPPSLEQIIAYTAADENPFPRFHPDYLVPPAGILLAGFFLLRLLFRRRKKRVKMPDIKPTKRKLFR